jgi:hypothetical protein
MYGLIAKLTVVPGRREEMIGILRESASVLRGCLSYVIAKTVETKMQSGSQKSGKASLTTTPLCRCPL